MGEQPGTREEEEGFEGALATSALSNSTAFGYSIMITVSFGVVSKVQGQAAVLDLFAFAFAATTSVAIIEAVITRGFRRRLEGAPPEVEMLGTAINTVSVLGSVAVALATAELLPGVLAWLIAAFAASGAYVLLEGTEILVATWIQAARGDPDAEE